MTASFVCKASSFSLKNWYVNQRVTGTGAKKNDLDHSTVVTETAEELKEEPWTSFRISSYNKSKEDNYRPLPAVACSSTENGAHAGLALPGEERFND